MHFRWRRTALAAAAVAVAGWLSVDGPARAEPVIVPPGEPVVITALGDSLVAGFGLPEEAAFPHALEAALAKAGIAARVINAGVSGDTSAGGLARLEWALSVPADLASRDQPDLVIVELGANDGLRGLDPAATRANIDAIVGRLAARGIPVLLTGMLAPPNLGRDYGARFNAIFPEVAAKYDVAFYPFFLDEVAAEPALNQPDGLHPNAAGVARIVDNILPFVLDALKAAGTIAQDG